MEIAVDHDYNLRLAKPMSRKEIEHFARYARKEFGVKGLYVDIMKILEVIIPADDEDFHFEIYKVTDFLGPKPAYYDSEKNCIFIREDIYNNAIAGDGYARFTIAHEIGHYCLISVFGNPGYISIEEIENYSDPKLRSMDPEWQTDVFAGEFLCCSEVIKDLTWKEIQAKCVVTEAAARTAWKIVNEVPYSISENKSMYSVRYNYYVSNF